MRNQLAIIVGPLLSLARDQVERLRVIGIGARLVHAEVLALNSNNFSNMIVKGTPPG